MPLKTWIRSLFPTLFLLTLPALAVAQMSVNVSVNVPPPELPEYDQPPIPDYGYIWTPGYWAWGEDDEDYYWVPGTWVLAPQPEVLWTPGYWGAEGALFVWHMGYWGPHVGFYGGVNYGYGYAGRGYDGGYWEGGRFYYNRAVNNITRTNINYVYNRPVNNNVNRVSYQDGRVQPTPAELTAARERHIPLVPVQRQHEQVAHSNPVLRASQNQGRPPIAATPRPAAFSGPGVVPARGGNLSVVHPQNPPQNQPQNQPRAEAQQRGQSPARGDVQPRTQPQPPAERQPRGQPQPEPRTEIQPRVQSQSPAEAQPRAQPPPHPVQPEPRVTPAPAPRPAAAPPPPPRPSAPPRTESAPRPEPPRAPSPRQERPPER